MPLHLSLFSPPLGAKRKEGDPRIRAIRRSGRRVWNRGGAGRRGEGGSSWQAKRAKREREERRKQEERKERRRGKSRLDPLDAAILSLPASPPPPPQSPPRRANCSTPVSTPPAPSPPPTCPLPPRATILGMNSLSFLSVPERKNKKGKKSAERPAFRMAAGPTIRSLLMMNASRAQEKEGGGGGAQAKKPKRRGKKERGKLRSASQENTNGRQRRR